MGEQFPAHANMEVNVLRTARLIAKIHGFPARLWRKAARLLLAAVFMLLCLSDVPAAAAKADPAQDAAQLNQAAPPGPIVGEEELYLAIHKKRHQLHVIMNGQVIYAFPVATGRGNLTPEGEFRIVTKVHKPYYMRKNIAGGHPDNPLGTRWMGLSIDGGYKYGIHGTNRPWSIGLSASSGCIRMRNKDVEYLYRHIPLKTRVIITND